MKELPKKRKPLLEELFMLKAVKNLPTQTQTQQKKI